MTDRIRNPAAADAEHDSDEITSIRPRAKEWGSLAIAVQAALQLACAEQSRVQVVVRGDPSAGRPVQIVEGVVRGIRESRDGRERVVLEISEDAQRVLPLDMIIRVTSAG